MPEEVDCYSMKASLYGLLFSGLRKVSPSSAILSCVMTITRLSSDIYVGPSCS